MTEVALVGDPVAHSVSPAIQTAAFAAVGLDWKYLLVRVADGELEDAWPGLARRFHGINITSPHKQTAARLADSLSPTARTCASVNTLTFGPSGSFGDSTDGAGFIRALRRVASRLPATAVVLGTGGAARAVVAALSVEGVAVRVVGRNQVAGQNLAQDLAEAGPGAVDFLGDGEVVMTRALVGAELLVNATTVGSPSEAGRTPLPDGVPLSPDLIVFDMVYLPRRTPLLRRAQAAGCLVVEGLEMLVQQGGLSFEAWTGVGAPLEVMREAADLAVAGRS
ncbi:MAG TPA: shikimate dehydrogenase [Candidatus Saccharimonadales bacterium]|nr:shikimate dehydrogenase [Candidatus Saccharimonadales bacterium]